MNLITVIFFLSNVVRLAEYIQTLYKSTRREEKCKKKAIGIIFESHLPKANVRV